MLDLGENVGRKEDSAPSRALLREQFVELLLVERIEAARWFIEYEEVRSVHEGEHEAKLLLVATRVFAKTAAKVELKSLRELGDPTGVDAAS